MKESKKSLKIYFIIVGILGALSGINLLIIYPEFLIKVFGIVTIVLAIMFLYYGIKLYDYLQNSPKTLINFVVIALAIQAVLRLLGGEFFYVIGIVLLGWYLVQNIKRLSTQTDNIDIKK